MSSQQIYRLTPEFTDVRTKATSTTTPLPFRREVTAAGTMSADVKNFKSAIKSGRILVKSVKSGEVKTLAIDDKVILTNPTMLNAFEVRDARVVPKQNYTKIDPNAVNIFAHKGPDEPASTDNGISGGAL